MGEVQRLRTSGSLWGNIGGCKMRAEPMTKFSLVVQELFFCGGGCIVVRSIGLQGFEEPAGERYYSKHFTALFEAITLIWMWIYLSLCQLICGCSDSEDL